MNWTSCQLQNITRENLEYKDIMHANFKLRKKFNRIKI